MHERGYDTLLARVANAERRAPRLRIALAHAVEHGQPSALRVRGDLRPRHRRDARRQRRRLPVALLRAETVMQEYSRLAGPGASADEGDTHRRRDPQRRLAGRPRVHRRAAAVAVGERARARPRFARCSSAPRRICSARSSGSAASERHLLAALVLLQLLSQRPERHRRRRAAARRAVDADLQRSADRPNGEGAQKERLATTLMGYARAQSRHHPRPADAGHRLRSRVGPRGVRGHDAKAQGMMCQLRPSWLSVKVEPRKDAQS